MRSGVSNRSRAVQRRKYVTTTSHHCCTELFNCCFAQLLLNDYIKSDHTLEGDGGCTDSIRFTQKSFNLYQWISQTQVISLMVNCKFQCVISCANQSFGAIDCIYSWKSVFVTHFGKTCLNALKQLFEISLKVGNNFNHNKYLKPILS